MHPVTNNNKTNNGIALWQLTIPTADDSIISGMDKTVKYEMFTNRYRMVMTGMPIIRDSGRFLKHREVNRVTCVGIDKP